MHSTHIQKFPASNPVAGYRKWICPHITPATPMHDRPHKSDVQIKYLISGEIVPAGQAYRT